MTQPYIDVTEFIENEHKLISDGTYYYDDTIYGIVQPLSPKYDFQFFGDYKNVNVNSPFPLNQLIDVPESGIKKSVMIGDTLLLLDNNETIHFYHFNSGVKGEYVDDGYINSTFDSKVINSDIHDIIPTPGSHDGAIFITMTNEAVFHNVPTPPDIDTLINGRLVVEAAIDVNKNFCLIFDTGEVLFYNGNDDQTHTSYNLIPKEIIDFEGYSSFKAENYQSPSSIVNASEVVAHDTFSLLTFNGNIIVWGGDFQQMNDGTSTMKIPVKNDVDTEITTILGTGHNFAIAFNLKNEVVGWGEDNNNVLTHSEAITDFKHIIVLPNTVMHTGRYGKDVHFLNDKFPNNEPAFNNVGSLYDISDIEDFHYINSIAYNGNGDFYLFAQHDNRDNQQARVDFKLRKHDGRYYIPIMHFMEYEPANINLEVYSYCRSEYESIGRNIEFAVVDTYNTGNGVADFSKIVITPIDKDRNGVPDDPLAYKMIVDEDDFIIMETFVDNNGMEATRIANEVKLISDTLYIEPNVIHYADIDRDMADYEGNKVTYKKGNFYKGDDLIDEIIPNTATIIPENIDDDTGITYIIEKGRSFTDDDPFKFQWTHYSSDGADRIDPSVSNIMDMFVLTNAYHNDVQRWLRGSGDINKFPIKPTPEQIRNNIQFIERYKSTSDQMIYIPAEYKLLFGDTARPEYQAEFKIIKLDGATLTDNEIKSKTIEAINDYFDIDNWDFGDSFYFTELAAHIHNWLSGHVASVVIVPRFETSSFGDLFQIKCEPHELFLSTAKVNNVIITNQYTSKNLRKMR